MHTYIRWFLFVTVLLSGHLAGLSQEKQESYVPPLPAAGKIFGALSQKTAAAREAMTKQTAAYLQRLQKQENGFRKKFARKDSVAAAALFANSDQRYRQLLSELETPKAPADPHINVYSSQLDSLKTTLKFLDQNKVFSASPAVLPRILDAGKALTNAQASLNQTARIDQFLKERQQLLQDKLGLLGYTTALRNFKKQVYYYHQQTDAYKQLLENPEALGAKAMSVVKQLPAFQKFFSNHSELAGLFLLPGATAPDLDTNSVAGLQTRGTVEAEMQGKYGKTVNAQQIVQKNVQAADESGIKQHGGIPGLLPIGSIHLPEIGGGNGQELATPDFKPNAEHNKTFWKRLNLGFNLQTVRSNGYWPATTDIGLSIGYRLSDNNVLAIGGSYKMGWGKTLQQVSLSGQGAGIRIGWDRKLKGSIWLTAGAELNYRQQGEGHIRIPDYNEWQKSALAGITKKYRIGKKMNGNMQLLVDCLHASHLPATPPLLFRVGYGF